jgi:phosphoribosylaminoimidazolecarboxamide formyltransferase/IMP cyclohydrolase
LLGRKRLLRLLMTGGMPDPKAPDWLVRSVSGGLLVQERDRISAGPAELKIVTARPPTDGEIVDLLFADTVAKHVKSNAIVYAKDGTTSGIGAGQMSRVDAARIAAAKAREAADSAGWPEPRTKGSAAASDAFFPFPDGLLAVAEAGATAVIQPGGSVKDKEVIKAADDAGIAMVFTAVRHFRH